jgi:eukaryotic-like serine/threonine-protein kinase
MTDAYIGRPLANRYQLIELIGKGAMGRVYRAEDVLLGGVPVAVKFLANTLLNPKMRERFEREATTCAILGQKSINIVRVMDYGVDDAEIPFYVMEYLQGQSLSELIVGQPLSVHRFINLARQMCLGLQCAHQGVPIHGKLYPIIHRDIKPSNILVCQDVILGDLVKILDFGIAKLLQEDSDQTSSFMGTLAYSSPEQMEGKELDNRSDIYSLGVVMFEMLANELPLQPETHTFSSWYKAHHFQSPRSLISLAPQAMPKALNDLIMACLAKTPKERPDSVEVIIRQLEAIDIGQVAPSPLPSTPPTAPSSFTTTPPLPVQDLPETQPSIPKVVTEVLTAPAGALSLEQACQVATWPTDKPLAEIVFPQVLATAQESTGALWVMLTRQEILNRQSCSRYNQFLYLQSPHPMMLWITVLYNRDFGPRWLPCYVDLKTTKGQELARLLGDQGQYRILLFALEEPQVCKHVLTSTIATFQCPMLNTWANSSQIARSVDQPSVSKKILKAEYEKMKPKILMKLESTSTTDT